MTQAVTSSVHDSRVARRAPWPVRILSTVVVLLSVVTSYGAVYFSFYFESPDPGVGTWVFATSFLAINVVAATSAVGLYRGSRRAWLVLVGYGVLGILWCIAKLVFWAETESLVFGVSNVLALWLLGTPATRRHVA